MNKDQIKGTAKNIGSKAQEQFGKMTGSKSQQVKGQAKQVTGKVQKGVGDAKQTVKDSTRH